MDGARTESADKVQPIRLNARIVVAGSVVFLVLILAVIFTVRHWTLQRDLILSDPDATLDNPALAAFALDEGRRVFAADCSSCHGAAGKGDRTLGVPDLADRDYLYGEGRVSEIEDIVRHGIRAGDRRGRNFAYMPAYASAKPYAAEPIPPLSPSDVHDVVESLLALEGRPADLAAASRGRAVYLGRGGCYDCHGGDAKGDPAIGAPNLADDIWLYGDGSAQSIAQSIEFGRKGYSPAFAGVLDMVETRAVAIYTASLSAKRATAAAQ